MDRTQTVVSSVCLYLMLMFIRQFDKLIFIYLLRQLSADTAHTTNTTTQKIYRNTKFKNKIKLTTIYENHRCSTINHTIHENLKIKCNVFLFVEVNFSTSVKQIHLSIEKDHKNNEFIEKTF